VNARQLLKLIAIVVASGFICFVLLAITSGSAAPVFEEILSAFLVLATLLVASTWPLFTYVESISKELIDLRDSVDRKLYEKAIEKLSLLKKEILSNGGLVLALFVTERALRGLSLHLGSDIEADPQVGFALLGLRFGMFVVALFAASIQLKGFLTAVEFRDVIAKGRK